MVVDSSVLIAVLLLEPDAEQFLNQLIDAGELYLSAVSLVETAMVIEYKKGKSGADKLDELLDELKPIIVEFDQKQAALARTAWREYGKGRHPAKLNFTDTCDVLESLGFDCHPDLFEVIAKSFVYDEWVEAAGGIWTGSQAHEEMSYEWDRFTRIVKYELRYFFDHARSSSIDEEYEPGSFLPTIGRLVTKLNLTETINPGTVLFRARPMKNGEN